MHFKIKDVQKAHPISTKSYANNDLQFCILVYYKNPHPILVQKAQEGSNGEAESNIPDIGGMLF